MAYDYGGHERAVGDASYRYQTDSANNAYGRFLSQQRGQRNLGDMSRQFGRDAPGFKASYGQRGLAGPGVQSGVKKSGMQSYYNDYSRHYGRGQQDTRQELQQYDLNQSGLDSTYQRTLADLEAQKAAGIAADAQNLAWLRQQYGGS